MSTNSIPVGCWQEFRDGLFDLIEKRRDIASSFKHLEIYFFIIHCRTAFNSPGTDKAQEALDAIAEDGSFRLVVDLRMDFLAMFAASQQTLDGAGATVRPGASKPEGDKSAVGPLPRDDSANSAHRSHSNNPPSIRRTVEGQKNIARSFRDLTSARPRSGRPFRPGEGEPTYE